MPSQRPSVESSRTHLGASTLPPTLEINPIQSASAPNNRKASAFISALISLGLFGGGLYFIELGQRDHFRPAKGSRQAVRLLLQDEFQLTEASGGNGGFGSRNSEKADQPMDRAISAVNPVTLHAETPQEPLDQAVPLVTPTQFPELKAGVQIPLLPGASVGNGIGNAVGSGIGNGTGNGVGRGRGATWIHSASGGEGVQVAESYMDVKDYIPPEYPSAARLARISGDVVIEVTIDEMGKPVEWKVLEGHPSLVAATMDVFPRWQFAPVRYKGQKVRATFEARIRFTLF